MLISTVRDETATCNSAELKKLKNIFDIDIKRGYISLIMFWKLTIQMKVSRHYVKEKKKQCHGIKNHAGRCENVLGKRIYQYDD